MTTASADCLTLIRFDAAVGSTMMSVGMDYAVLPVHLLFSIPHAPAYADSRSVRPIVGIARFRRHPGGACTISTDSKKGVKSIRGIG